MPKRRYERREPTNDWQQRTELLKDTTQINYEVIRPVVLWDVTPKERAAETGVPQQSIYYRANLFDQAGMASLLPAEPPLPVPKQDKRALRHRSMVNDDENYALWMNEVEIWLSAEVHSWNCYRTNLIHRTITKSASNTIHTRLFLSIMRTFRSRVPQLELSF